MTDYRLLVKHNRHTDYHEWWMPGRVEWRGKSGMKRGRGFRWHVLECNNTECNGLAVISERAIIALADRAADDQETP